MIAPMSERSEIVLVVSPRGPAPEVGPLDAIVGAAGDAVTRVASTVEAIVGGAVSATLDKVVPAAVGVVLDRIDLGAVVNRALDQIDLTQIVVDRVDVDRIAEQVDLAPIMDRLPLIDLANYIIDEIDLPSIIRDSTGGIASDALNSIRMQSTDADVLLAHVVDRILLRRRQRDTDSPGDPQSMLGESAQETS